MANRTVDRQEIVKNRQHHWVGRRRTRLSFRIKSHTQGRERLVAACDEELLGQTYAEGQLRLHVNKDFYDGFAGDEEALEQFLRRCTVANLVGKRTVDLAIKLGFVAEENVLLIQGVPHAQWALMF